MAHALCQAAYATEARLLECHDFPPLKESPGALAASKEHLLGAWEGPILIGVLGHERGPGYRRISRLAVSPEHMRQGVGGALVQDLFRRYPGETMIVESGAENLPAISLYRKSGFAPAGTWLSKEGIVLVRLIRS